MTLAMGISGQDLTALNEQLGGPYIVLRDGSRLWPDGTCLAAASKNLQPPPDDPNRRNMGQRFYHKELLKVLQGELTALDNALHQPGAEVYHCPDGEYKRWLTAIVGCASGNGEADLQRLRRLIEREEREIALLNHRIVEPLSPCLPGYTL